VHFSCLQEHPSVNHHLFFFDAIETNSRSMPMVLMMLPRCRWYRCR